MTCKKKKSTLVLSQPHVQIILLQVLLVTGTPECLGQAASLHPSWSRLPQTSPEGQRDGGLLFLPSLPFWLHAYAFSPALSPSPGFWGAPVLAGECTSANLAPAVATRGAEGHKTRRSLPFRKRQPMTPQKKTLFPSVSLQRNGRWGPSCSSNPEYQKGIINTQDLRAWCKQPPSAGRPSSVYFACWPLFKK